MTYYYEGSPIVAPFIIESNRYVLSSESASLKMYNRTTNAQRWEMSFTIKSNSSLDDLFIGMLEDQYKSSNMTMPQITSVDARVTAIAEPSVLANASATESTLTVGSSETGTVLPKGTFIKFSGHDKIYTLTADATTGPSFIISVFPELRKDVAAAEDITHAGSVTKPTIAYFRDPNAISGLTYTDGVLVNLGTIKLIEAL